MSLPPKGLALLLLTGALWIGCAAPRGPDPRLSTPSGTVETVLAANHLLGMRALSMSAFGDERSRPEPDLSTLATCFYDFDRDDPSSRAMADFVTGVLAAGQERLLYDIDDQRATVSSGIRPVEMRRSRIGWQIVLAESVPEEIRERLHRLPPDP